MDYFSGYLTPDCSILFLMLKNELKGSKSSTIRRDMFKNGFGETEKKGSYSITIGHTNRGQLYPSTRYREESDIFKYMYKTTAYSDNPILMEYLVGFGKHHFPDYEFTETQVNFNWQSPKHKDKGNDGESMIIGLGDYTGGNLIIEKENEILSVDIHNKPYKFDGGKYTHFTENYIGNRMSIVFYNIAKKRLS